MSDQIKATLDSQSKSHFQDVLTDRFVTSSSVTSLIALILNISI